MRPIPPRMRRELAEAPRMKECPLKPRYSLYGPCGSGIEWHHVWTYAGTQINEVWAIVGACRRHHEAVKTNPLVRDAFEIISLKLSHLADLQKYPRKNWHQIKKSLGIIP